MKLLGLDVGDRRIGIAFGETDLRIATPSGVVVRSTGDGDLKAIRRWIDEYDAEGLVIGLPRNMDGTLGDQAKETLSFGDRIAKAIDIRIEYWDERLSTVEAARRTREAGAQGRRGRRTLDATAAAVILQDYMDAQAGKSKETS